MSDMKYNAIVESGIRIVERVPIPPELIPKDAQVKIWPFHTLFLDKLGGCNFV